MRRKGEPGAVSRGEALNGVELWRRLFWDHLDGGVTSNIKGATYSRTFPRCEHFEDLQAHVDEWLLLRDDVASEMSDLNILHMLFDMFANTIF